MIETVRSQLMAARLAATTIPSSREISLTEGYEIGAEVEPRPRSVKATTALGGPVPALVWLLRGLREGLRAGEVVTTGSMIGATPVSMGQRWTNRHHGSVSSSVEVTFT